MAQHLATVLLVAALLSTSGAEPACGQGCSGGNALLQKATAVSLSQDVQSRGTVVSGHEVADAADKDDSNRAITIHTNTNTILDALVRNTDDILDKLTTIEENTAPASAAKKAVGNAKDLKLDVTNSANAIKECVTSTCDGMKVASTLLGLAATIMTIASVALPAGPILAMLGALIFSLLQADSPAEKKLTVADIKAACIEGIVEVRDGDIIEAQLPSLADEAKGLLQRVLLGKDAPDEFMDHLPDIIHEASTLSATMMTSYRTLFGSSEHSTRNTLAKTIAFSTKCTEKCGHNGWDWSEDCVADMKAWDTKTHQWKKFKMALSSWMQVGTFLQLTIPALINVAQSAGWTDNDYKYNLHSFEAAIQASRAAAIALDTSMRDMKALEYVDENFTILPEQQYMDAGYFWTNRWAIRDRDPASVPKVNYPEIITFGEGPVCGDQSGHCDDSKGLKLLGNLKLDGDCESGLGWYQQNHPEVRFFYHRNPNPETRDSIAVNTFQSACIDSNTKCWFEAIAAVCARQDICAPNVLRKFISSEANFMTFHPVNLDYSLDCMQDNGDCSGKGGGDEKALGCAGLQNAWERGLDTNNDCNEWWSDYSWGARQDETNCATGSWGAKECTRVCCQKVKGERDWSVPDTEAAPVAAPTLAPPTPSEAAPVAAPTPAPPTPSSPLNVVTEDAPGVGDWGGSCTCPDGQVYQVGDMGDGCQSMACVGGASGYCNKYGGAWNGRKVECAQ